MKLVLGIPTAGQPAEPFLSSIQKLQLPSAITAILNKTAMGNFVPAQREMLVRYALRNEADWLLMADDDMVIPSDAVARLLEPFDDATVGLVGALYYSRDGLRPMAVDDWDPSNTTGASIPAFDDRTPTRVGGVGFGLVLIRASVFGHMQPPYFPAQVYLEAAQSRVRVCNEDYLFCKRLHDGGWNTVLHPGVRCGHYDRAGRQVYPLAWEPIENTNVKRMMVRQGDGTIGMRPFDGSVGRAAEQHQRADLEYILAD